MNLDFPTLGIVFALNTAVLAILLLFSWALNRKVQALAWWGLAFFLVLSAMGIASLGQGTPSIATVLIATTSLALAYGALYGGCRAFNGRPVTRLSVLTGAIVWCIVFLVFTDAENVRFVFMSAMAAGYSALSAWELWRNARQRLASQLVAVTLLIGLVAFNVFRGMLGLSLGHVFWIDASLEPWSTPMAVMMAAFMAMLMPALAFVFLSMAKEQLEYEYRQAALVDPLTRIPNRRAFFEKASPLLSRQRTGPVSCMLFDLDNFKNINDSYGHEVGDHVLEIFGRVLSDHLSHGAFGRLGGEEFGAIVPMGKAEAEALAEEIRHSFATVGKVVRGVRIEVTVSVGCATGTAFTVQELLRQADIALYRAKAEGRNMVASARGGEK